MRTPALLSRKPVSPPAQQRMTTKTFPAPLRGIVANESLVLSQPAGALVLENYIITKTSIKPRGGSAVKATVGSRKVETLLTYKSGIFEAMFAASDGKIFDVSEPADVNSPPTPDVTGQTSNYYGHAQFATAGGEFLIIVNGDNLHWTYNGATWAQNTPAITGTTSDKFSHVWSYRNRLFFVKKNTKTACYLPVDSIGGVTTDFTLDGIFKYGGTLLFGATWSLDAGDGLDDKCVFVSTNGEAAIYEGSNPSSVTDWSLVGRYDIAKPLGINATMQAGGDLLVATIEGLIPLSEAIRKDPAALSLSAISQAIEPLWRDDAFNRSGRPWEVMKWVEKNMAIVAAPGQTAIAPTESQWGFGVWGTFIWGGGNGDSLTQLPYCYAVNLQSGAWTKFTGWDVQCLAHYKGFVYFGTADGSVMQALVGSSDAGKPYICRYAGLFERLSANASVKQLHQARATWSYGREFIDKISFSKNYTLKWPSAPSASPNVIEGAVWDSAIWDNAVWDSEPNSKIRQKWVSVGQSGYAVSPMAQITCAGTVVPDAELVSIDLTYESGGVVV